LQDAIAISIAASSDLQHQNLNLITLVRVDIRSAPILAGIVIGAIIAEEMARQRVFASRSS
jgi:hypothetical protein